MQLMQIILCSTCANYTLLNEIESSVRDVFYKAFESNLAGKVCLVQQIA